jgi:hypothetical protein
MKVNIGLKDAQTISLESSLSAKEIEKLLNDAKKNETMFSLTDKNDGQIFIADSRFIYYIIVDEKETHPVGFGR